MPLPLTSPTRIDDLGGSPAVATLEPASIEGIAVVAWKLATHHSCHLGIVEGRGEGGEPFGFRGKCMGGEEHDDISRRFSTAAIQRAAVRELLWIHLYDARPVPGGDRQGVVGRAGIDENDFVVSKPLRIDGGEGRIEKTAFVSRAN